MAIQKKKKRKKAKNGEELVHKDLNNIFFTKPVQQLYAIA